MYCDVLINFVCGAFQGTIVPNPLLQESVIVENVPDELAGEQVYFLHCFPFFCRTLGWCGVVTICI